MARPSSALAASRDQVLALAQLLGVRVEVRTPAEISRHIRDRALAEALPL
ncbi:MAG: hypothetical protein AB7O31_12605 [Burkholderiales bacterium]